MKIDLNDLLKLTLSGIFGIFLTVVFLTIFSGSGFAQHEIELQQVANSGPVRDDIQEFNQLFGWPRSMEGQIPMWGRCPTVVDLDGNHDWELTLLTSDGTLNMYQHDGAFYPGYPSETHQGNRPSLWVNPTHNSTSAVIDITGDGTKEIVFLSDLGFLNVIDHNGNQPEPFPLDISRNLKAGVLAVADINNDESHNIIFNTYSDHPDSINADGWIHVVRGTGRELAGWPVSYSHPSGSSPAVGNIVGGDELEIVIGNARRLNSLAQIWAWRPDGSLVDNFPIGSFETIHGAPALADLTGDGKLEIIIWAYSPEGGGAGIYAFNGSGELLEGYPLECPTGHPEGNPAIADITGDESPEIVFANYNPEEGGSLYAWSTNGEIGELIEGFPISLNASVAGSVILADVSGDRVSDIVLALSPSGNNPGMIAGISGDGEVIENFPISMDRWNNAIIAGTPSLWDIDRDSDLDLIAVTTDRRILIWDTPGRIGHDTWATYKGDMFRTGRRPADNPNAIEDDSEIIVPDQFSISMYPNPFNSVAQISLVTQISGNAHLELFNIEGRSLGTVFNGDVAVGRTQIPLVAGELELTAGLYLCRAVFNKQALLVRVVYIP